MPKYINYPMSNNNDHDLETLPLSSGPSVDADAANYSDEQSESDKEKADKEKKLTEGQAKYKKLEGAVRLQRLAKSDEAAAKLTAPILAGKTDVDDIHEDIGIDGKRGLRSGVDDPVTQKDPNTRINLNDPDQPLTDAQAKEGAESLKDAIAKRNDDTIKAAAAVGEVAKVEVAIHSNEQNENRVKELTNDPKGVASLVKRSDAIAKGTSFSGDGGVDKAIVGLGDDVQVSGPVVEVKDKDPSESIEEQGQV